MATLDEMKSLENLMRLSSGLKNVSGRRKVVPGAEFLQDLEAPSSNVSGTAQPAPPFKENLPEADLGGELTPQSYDVRANVVETQPMVKEEPSETNLFQRLGRWIKERLPSESGFIPSQSVAQTPPVATAEVDASEGLPPITASQQVAEEPNFFQRTADKLRQFVPNMAEADRVPPGSVVGNPFLPPTPAPTPIDQSAQQVIDQKMMDQAQQNPWSVAAYGATDAFANRPDLVQDFQTYTGLNFGEQEKELTKKYEQVLSDIQNNINQTGQGYDEQTRRIQERILSNQATDNDKYFIGLALLMPLLLGGIFGKEAGIGALGGVAKGVAEIYGNRAKRIQEDEDLLAGINKQQGELDLKRGELEIQKLQIPQQVKSILPKDEYEDLKGMKIYTFSDPETGEIIAQGPEVLPDLYADMSYSNTPEKRKDLRKEAKELETEKASLQRANAATEKVIKAAMQLKDTGILGKILSYALSEEKTNALKKIMRQMAPDIVADGRKQNSAVYLDHQIELIKDAYRRNEQMRTYTNTVAQHIGSMAENPLYSGLRPEDLIDQMLILRDRAQNFFVDRAVAQGFLGAPLINLFGKENRSIYKGLNRKVEKQEIEKDKLKAIQNG